MKPERTSRDRPFDSYSVDRIRVREILEYFGEDDPTDAEIVDEIMDPERPAHGLCWGPPEYHREILKRAVAEERTLAATGEALGPDADPRYIARTERRAEPGVLFDQLDELAEKAEKVAERARELASRRWGEWRDGKPVTSTEGVRLMLEAEAAWALARRIERATANRVGYPEWTDAEDRGEGESDE